MKQTIKPGAEIDAVTRAELETILRESATAEHVAFGSDSIERRVRDWPVKGHERKVRATRYRGDDAFAVPAGAAVFTDVFLQDQGRGGLSIVNAGANPCFVYLAPANVASDVNGKVAAYYIPANGNWDGRISGYIWTGAVSVRSVLGTTLVLASIS